MAQKISALPSATSVLSVDVLPVVQNAETKKVTAGLLSLATLQVLAGLPGFAYLYLGTVPPTQGELDAITTALGITEDQILYGQTSAAPSGSDLSVRSGASLTVGGLPALVLAGGTLASRSGASLTDGQIRTLLDASTLSPLAGASLTVGAIPALALAGGTMAPRSGASLSEGALATLQPAAGTLTVQSGASLSTGTIQTLQLAGGTETLLFSDDFNRAAQNPLAGNWTTYSFGEGLKLANNRLEVISYRGAAYVNSVTPAQNQFVSAAIDIMTSGKSGIIARGLTSQPTFYWASAYFDGEEGMAVELIAVVNGAVSYIAQIPIATWYTHLRMEVTGPGTATVIKLYHATSPTGPWTLFYTSPTRNDGSQFGNRFGVAIESTYALVDDFRAGNLG